MIPRQHTVETPYMVGPVHCYSSECNGELVLFDTGPPTDAGRAFLQSTFDLSRLRHVLVTHCHIDHYGQSAWLLANTGAELYLPYRDVLKITHHVERMRLMYDLLSGLGFGMEYLDELRRIFNRGALFPPFPDRYRIAETDLPVHLGIKALPCPGHSQSDLVYHGDAWAITGDTLLRGIFQSPLLDIDTQTGGRFNNYRAYCSSIVKLAGLRDKRILPGHRQTIECVDDTIFFYISKLLQRVRQIRPHLGRNSVAEVIGRVFADMNDPFHVYLKASEIVFMKDLLDDPQPLHDALDLIDLFSRVEEAYDAAVAG